MKKLIPIESLEGITIMGQSQMTAKCTEECLKRGIPVVYFSKGGVYFGRVMSTSHINAGGQRMQSALYDTEFAVELGKRILSAKIKKSECCIEKIMKKSRNNNVLRKEQKNC